MLQINTIGRSANAHVELHEIDQAGFWKVLNSNKSCKRKQKSYELCGKSEITVDDILNSWSEYLSFSNKPCFDSKVLRFSVLRENTVFDTLQTNTDNIENNAITSFDTMSVE